MVIGERIRAKLVRLDMSQSELGRRVGMSQAMIHKLISGQSANSSKIHRIAQVLDTTVEYLTGEVEDPDRDALSDRRLDWRAPPTEKQVDAMPDLASIPQLDLAYSMGGGQVIEEAETVGQHYFNKGWLRSMMAGAMDDLFVARGEGDSMIPTLMDGDIAIVDRAQNSINRADRIWCLAYGELGMIKRVRGLPEGGYAVMSDNPSVSDFTAFDGEMHVIGRVIAIIRKM